MNKPQNKHYEEFDGEIITRRLKNVFVNAGLKTWAEVAALSDVWYLKGAGEACKQEALAVMERRTGGYKLSCPQCFSDDLIPRKNGSAYDCQGCGLSFLDNEALTLKRLQPQEPPPRLVCD